MGSLVRGYGNWQCLSKTLQSHETSTSHIDAYLRWKELASCLSSGRTIDSDLQRLIEREKAHWRGVLTRILDSIFFLAERNLPLRGKDANLGSPRKGNFLGVLELLARYDMTMADHLKKVASKETTSYLTWCTQNEI